LRPGPIWSHPRLSNRPCRRARRRDFPCSNSQVTSSQMMPSLEFLLRVIHVIPAIQALKSKAAQNMKFPFRQHSCHHLEVALAFKANVAQSVRHNARSPIAAPTRARAGGTETEPSKGVPLRKRDPGTGRRRPRRGRLPSAINLKIHNISKYFLTIHPVYATVG